MLEALNWRILESDKIIIKYSFCLALCHLSPTIFSSPNYGVNSAIINEIMFHHFPVNHFINVKVHRFIITIGILWENYEWPTPISWYSWKKGEVWCNYQLVIRVTPLSAYPMKACTLPTTWPSWFDSIWNDLIWFDLVCSWRHSINYRRCNDNVTDSYYE